MDSSVPGLACVALIAVVFVLPMWAYLVVVERIARGVRARAIAAGRNEPVTIQPLIDLSSCMGSGACVPACPEHVLTVVDGYAVAANMSACIGHGACVSACPVGAISLVFGSENRGIDIPNVGPDFQTNVPGVFIAGELGGMGLIANAAEQGVKALGNAKASLRSVPGRVDVAIVGAGPAGIAAAAAAAHRGVSYVLLDQEEVGGTIRHYPRKKLVFTRPMVIPGYPKVNLKTLRKEELVDLFRDIIAKLGLVVSAGERVDAVTRLPDGGFRVKTTKREIEAQRVILALGRRGTPRKLMAPGEELEKVAYSLTDPELYSYDHVMVVGAGDSAVEAVLALSEQPGNRVTLSYRGDKINRPKEKNLELLQKATKAGRIDLLLESKIERITKDRVILKQRGAELVVPNDHLFVMVGGVLPIDFLKAIGIRIETHFGDRVEHVEDPPIAAPSREQTAPRAERIPAPRGNDEPTVSLGPADPGSFHDDLEIPVAPAAEEVPEVAQSFVAQAERLFDAGDPAGVLRFTEVFRQTYELRATAQSDRWVQVLPWVYLLEGEARLQLGEPEAAIALLETAIDRGTPQVRALGSWALGRASFAVGRLDLASELLNGVLRTWAPPPSSHVDGLAILARIALLAGDVDRARRGFEAVETVAREGLLPTGAAIALHGYACCALAKGDAEAAREPIARALKVLGPKASPMILRPVLIDAIEIATVAGRYGAAARHADALGRATADDGSAEALVARGGVALLVGRAREARGSMRAALESMGDRPIRCPLGIRAARVALDLGLDSDVRKLLERVTEGSSSVLDDEAGQLLAVRARAAARTERVRARQLAGEVLERPPPASPVAGVRILLDAARALGEAGEPGHARDVVKRALERVHGTGNRGLRLELAVLLAELRADAHVLVAVAREAEAVSADLPASLVASFRERPGIAIAWTADPDPGSTGPVRAEPPVPRRAMPRG